MADHALSCIASLVESIPVWIADIESILKASREKQDELLAEQQPVEPPPRSVRRKLSKSSSLRSKHSSNVVDEQPLFEPDKPRPDLLRPQLPHMTESDALRLSQRKRKTFSVCSGNPSAPHKYRSRAMVVVYYDGDTQKKFEALVRSIATSRNGVRRCKMNAKMGNMVRTESASSNDSSDGAEGQAEDGEEGLFTPIKLEYKSTRAIRVSDEPREHSDGADALGKVDGYLDKAQDLCERAAHQILRDGDCTLELNNAREQLDQAQELAVIGLPDFKLRAEKEADQWRISEEGKQARDRVSGQRGLQPDNLVAASPVPSLVSSLPSDGRLEVDLEADDSEGEDEDFKPEAFRFGKYQMRSTRLLAH